MNFTLEKLKEARDAGIPDDVIWETAASAEPKFNELKQNNIPLDVAFEAYQQFKPKAPEGIEGVAAGLEAGIGRAGTAFAQAAVASVRNLTDLFGANNPVSKKIAGVEDYIDQFTTAQAKQDNEEISRIFQEAESKGLGSKVLAGLEAVSVSPETMLAQTAGYMIPSLAAGALATLSSAPVTVAIGAQALVGGYQAAGMAKGDIYKAVRDYAREQGLDEVEADRAATEAQAYGGKNADLILLNAGLGAAAASTGAEKIAARIIAGKGKEVTKKSISEFLKQGTIGGLVEGGTEGLQEGAEQVSENIALQREGKDVPTFQNVPQAATMGAAAGAIMGGGFAGVEFLSAEEKEQRDIERSANREARSLSTTDTTTQKTVNDLNQTENAIDSLREELDTLEPTDPRAQQLRMRISEEQKKAAGIKTTIGEELSEAEKNRLAKEETPASIAAKVEQIKVNMAGVDPTSRRYAQLQEELSTEEGKLVSQQQAELAKAIAEEPVAPEVAQPTLLKPVRISTETLSGPKNVSGNEVLLPGYDGARLVVSEYKSKKGSKQDKGYRVYFRDSGALIEDSNGVTSLNDTLKNAITRINSDIRRRNLNNSYELVYQQIVERGKRAAKQQAPAVSETITEPTTAPAGPAVGNRIRKGEAGGVLIPSREDFEDLGRRIYEKGMQFKAWADRMVAEFGDAVREFLGSVWETVSGIPAKINELAGYLPGKGEGGGVLVPSGEKPQKRGELVSLAITREKTTPKDILAKTVKIIKNQVFDGDSEITEGNTNKAWNLISKLEASNPDSTDNAEAINQLTRETMQEVKLPENATIEEVETFKVIKETVGMPKLRNELYQYAIKLAGLGDKRMLDYLLNNELNLAGKSVKTGSDFGRFLGALRGLSSWIINATEAEQTGFFAVAAQQFFNTKNPTEEQIKQIQAMFNAVKKVKIDQEKELSAELEEVGKATGIDVAQKVIEAVESSVASRDPWIVAFEILRKELGEPLAGFAFKPFTMAEEIKKALIPKLANYQKMMAQQGAKGLEATFWKTMSDKEDKPGPLAEVDAAINRNLAGIVKETLIKLGLKGKSDNTKMTLIEQVANILTNQKLTQEKMVLADKRVLEEINRREGEAIERAGENQDAIDAAEAEAQALRDAWNAAMGQQMNLPVSEATLGRLINNEMKEAGTKLSEIDELSKLEPAIAESRKRTIVNSIINKLYGIVLAPTDRKPLTKEELAALDKQVSELEAELANDKKRKASQSAIDARQKELDAAIERRDAEKKRTEIPKRDYDLLSNALNEKFNQMIEARRLKARIAKAARDAKAELNKPDKQAESQIKRLAKLQSDTQDWAQTKKDEVKAIVQNDLRNTPDMGRKEPWKAMLVGQLKQAGVSDTQAGILADLVWNQHEKNALSREMDALNKAVEKGPIKGIVDAILNTPLSEQQKPEWRRDVIKKYLIDAGVASSKADNIAKLFDVSLQKRFAEAQVKAAENAAKAIIGKLTPNSRRAFDKFIKAIRAQALAPDTDVAKAFGQQMGYRGFTAEEYARISELDSVINNEETLDLERATAFKQIQNIISEASIPPRVRDAISSFYVAQALSGIPTATVNFFSPIGYAIRYAMTDGMKTAIKNPSKLPTVFSAMLSSFKSYASEVAYSWNNNVQRRGVVEYLANDEKLLAIYNKGKKQWAEGNRAEGFKNMLFGSMEYVSRLLKALDEGALSVLEQQGLSRYAMAAMDAAGIKASEQIAVANMVMKSKQEFILNSIAKGMNKRDAIAFSDDVYRSAWREALSDLKLDSQMVLDSAINDALSAVGRINITTDPLSGKEQKRVSDRGFASSIPISFLEAMSNAANAKTSNEIQRIFYRMMYGFAIVPARVMREAAWFSPYGFVRFAIDKGAKAKGYTSPYEQSLGTDVQRTQRLIETTAGTIITLGAMAMAKSSVDDPEDELPFKIVFTGNGPDRRLDPQFYDTWIKKFKPNSINIFFGKTKFSINIERGFEAFAVPFMFAGAIDDWRIRKQFEKSKKTPKDLSDAAIILGSAFMSFNKRGPYSAFTNVYSSYKNSDNMIAEMAKQGAFYGKTFIPVIGLSLARNVSDFINDPIDRTSLEGALYSNIPVLGPMMGTKSMNAVGQTQGATDFADRLYKAGIPLVFSLPKNTESQRINELILKQGQGPTIPTRYNVRQRLGYEPTNKQYEVFVTTYGQYMAKKMAQSHDSLMKKEPVSYMKWLEKRSNYARDVATREAKKIALPKKP